MKKNILKMMAEANSDEKGPEQPVVSPLSRSRRGSPVVSNVGKALNTLSESSSIVLDPAKIEASPYRDRFENDGEAREEVESLAASIRAEGQKMPVLVRPHPKAEGRYQLAYGHRRLAAIRLLAAESRTPAEVTIRAYVRPLDDRELLVEQSLENGVRENLTWIEQALWAAQLREAGFSSVAIEPVLGLSKTPISLMLKVANAVPNDIIFAIGRAKGVGRPKWMALAETCLNGGDEAIARIRPILEKQAFRSADAAQRIDLAVRAARGGEDNRPEKSVRELVSNGRSLGRIATGASGTTISIARQESGFAEWLSRRMDALAEEYFSSTTGANRKD
nr:plasmid partitioning protein RepB [Marinicella sp. W31]MDC2880193.1 plasmid partitioning protein RepB [Marinicella sp. W31]